jgi:hypothetical protein
MGTQLGNCSRSDPQHRSKCISRYGNISHRTYNLFLWLSWRNLCFISVCLMHRTLVTFLESEQSFLNDEEQNSSDHLSASKVSPPVLINLIFLLKVWYCEVWNTRVAILTQCKEAEDPGYRSWYSHPLKTERFEFRTQVDVIHFLRFTPVLKVPGTHPAFYILGTEAFPRE